MVLSIVIPTCNSDLIDLLCLLFSIRSQTAMDWSRVEVILVNDGGEPFPEDCFDILAPMQIRQINLEINVGPGMARQAGIDAAHGRYLMFCDADDTLHNTGVISTMLQTIMSMSGDEPDILMSKWYEEALGSDGGYIYVTHDSDWTWMHGKMIRAEFLREHNIRHHPDLRIHEDSYFLNLLAAYGPRALSVDTLSYVWRWHDGSITRRNSGAYAYESIPAFLHAVSLADAQFEQINPAAMPERIAHRVCYTYHLTHSDAVTEHPEYRTKAEEAFLREVGPYLHYWDDSTEQKRRDMYAQTIRFAAGAIPEESLSEWLSRVRSGGAVTE